MIEDGEMLFLSAGADFLAPSAVLSTLAEQKDGGGHHHGRADGSKADSKDGAHLPHTIGGYRVGILLGKGGFGEVRVGEHQITHEQVALKFLPKMEILNMGAAERTTTEIQCLCALKHGHIIRLVQQFESLSHIVLAFELMQGGDLLQYLMTELARPQLPEDEARAVFHQASARARRRQATPFFCAMTRLAFSRRTRSSRQWATRTTSTSVTETSSLRTSCSEAKGASAARARAGREFKHTDEPAYRPSPRRRISCVKIADFGLSDFYRPGAMRRTNCGSISYLAPEVFRGTSNAGPPLDIWSLGVIVFAMLCGRLPFEGTDLKGDDRPNEASIRTRIMKCHYKIGEALSPEVKDLVRRMLRLDPNERASVPEIFNHPWLRLQRGPNPSV